MKKVDDAVANQLYSAFWHAEADFHYARGDYGLAAHCQKYSALYHSGVMTKKLMHSLNYGGAMPPDKKPAVCSGCGKKLNGTVPIDVSQVICFECDNKRR